MTPHMPNLPPLPPLPPLPIWHRHVPPFLVGLLSELLFWGGLVFLTVNLGDRFVDWLELPFATGAQTLEIYFNDVSQLGSGSPVRWMGVDVGYVSHVKPEKGRVRVVAQIKPGMVIIPRGSHFTVEFNGLAGSKSLEIIPPRRAAKAVVGEAIEGYDIEEPIRIQDVLDTQMIVADAMEHSMHNIEKSLSQLEQRYEIESELQEALALLGQFDRHMGVFDTQVQRLRAELDAQTRDINLALADVIEPMEKFRRMPQPTPQDALGTLDTLNQVLADIQSLSNLIPEAKSVRALRDGSIKIHKAVVGSPQAAPSKATLTDAEAKFKQCVTLAQQLNETAMTRRETDPVGTPPVKSTHTLGADCIDVLLKQSQDWVQQTEKWMSF